ncbi:MAG: hypothetical protein CM15mP45_21280 [Deltaproteobacteria bacterium]|nr:MAG: hypothetical protein CM15mP45_21280 [Deltaproteobacteria bacterium]
MPESSNLGEMHLFRCWLTGMVFAVGKMVAQKAQTFGKSKSAFSLNHGLIDLLSFTLLNRFRISPYNILEHFGFLPFPRYNHKYHISF